MKKTLLSLHIRFNKKNIQPKTTKTLNQSKTRNNSNFKKEKKKVAANANKSCTKKKGYIKE